jgi:eukaryotic-like serine/threonine-protein kinase
MQPSDARGRPVSGDQPTILTPATARRLEGQEGVYELTSAEPIIFGRLSVFYPARDVGSGDAVLLKSFRDSPDARDGVGAFYEELRAIRQLRHPNILEILDYSPGAGPDAPPFLVLPWCQGGNLRALRGAADFLPLSSVAPLLEQVAGAIDYAHQQGVIHGDVKPENVLLSEDRRRALLADFGMAKFFDVADRVRVSGEVGTDPAAMARGGTSAYLSPEQLADNKQMPQSDIYSFALVAYELLTGRLPFDVSAPLYRQIHARVVGGLVDPADANPSLPEAAQAALRLGLATDPRRRPRTATDLVRMLTGAVPVPKGRGQRPSRREAAQGWWAGLSPAQKVVVLGAAITATSTVVVALIQILPSLLGLGGK